MSSRELDEQIWRGQSQRWIEVDTKVAQVDQLHQCHSPYKQMCHVGNKVEDCNFGLFQDVSFAGDLQNSKIHSWRHSMRFSVLIDCCRFLELERRNEQDTTAVPSRISLRSSCTSSRTT